MKKIYSIFDRKSTSYGPLFCVPHDAIAVRELGAAMRQERSSLAVYPDDFELHCVGEFHDEVVVGTPVVGTSPVVVMTCRQWLDAQPKARMEQIPLALEA